MKKLLLLVCVVCCVFSCSDDVERKLVLPTPPTVKANVVYIDEIQVNGELSKIGDDPIVDHGFIYATSQITTADQGTKVSLGVLPAAGTFSATITGLKKNTEYYIRSFVATATDVVLGGTTTVKTYNTNTWFQYPLAALDDDPLATSNYQGMQLVMNGKAYVGFQIAKGASGQDVIPVSEYDPVNNILTRLPDCPVTHTYYSGRFAIRNKIYVMNGSTREVAQYDLAAKTWKMLAKFPKEVSITHSFILYDEAYVITYNISKIETWKYNEVDDLWIPVSEWPESISPFLNSAVTLNDKVYLVVSQTGEQKLSYQWDPLKNEYKTLSAPPMPGFNGDTNFSYAIADEAGEFGYYGRRQPAEIWRYKPADDTWNTMALPSGNGNCLFALNGKLYSISNHLYQYVPE
jgi:hypothetical protein